MYLNNVAWKLDFCEPMSPGKIVERNGSYRLLVTKVYRPCLRADDR